MLKKTAKRKSDPKQVAESVATREDNGESRILPKSGWVDKKHKKAAKLEVDEAVSVVFRKYAKPRLK